ncbi:MAG: hypothetical protein SPL30_11095, partial [Succinivibrio sp.]|nr:hypothetical protein [Succinivibrio sp.]
MRAITALKQTPQKVNIVIASGLFPASPVPPGELDLRKIADKVRHRRTTNKHNEGFKMTASFKGGAWPVMLTPFRA